jgi:hypothetical protein
MNILDYHTCLEKYSSHVFPYQLKRGLGNSLKTFLVLSFREISMDKYGKNIGKEDYDFLLSMVLASPLPRANKYRQEKVSATQKEERPRGKGGSYYG